MGSNLLEDLSAHGNETSRHPVCIRAGFRVGILSGHNDLSRATRIGDLRLPLSERQVDIEELTRPCAAI
jgi:hypothetical protein